MSGFHASRRSVAPEWMDGPAEPAVLAACLADLERVNTVLMGRRPTLRWLARATRGWPRGRAFTLVDVGAGGGDMLRAVARWAAWRGFAAELTGYDINPGCVAAARAATPPGLPIRYETGDAMAAALAPDFIVTALVVHHMTDAEAARLLAWMERTARAGWFVNDLHRHWLAYHGFRALAAVARWHPFVRHDGPVSVARSFTRGDWTRLLAAAGVAGAQVRWWPLFRWGVERLR